MVDPARGGKEGLEELAEASRRAGIALVVDIVPNHMGVADPAQNNAWWELLREGAAGPFAPMVRRRLGRGRRACPDPGSGRRLRPGARSHPRARRASLRRPRLSRSPPTPTKETTTAAAVHLRQHYRLINERLAATDLNYRRFFAISDLAGPAGGGSRASTRPPTGRFCVGSPTTGCVALRIDHPDGLAAPGQYLERLAASAPDAWIVVEKITQLDEELPADWPVAGMTGYDALAQINALLTDPAGREPRSRSVYVEVTGDERSWREHVRAGKRHVATTVLQAEFRRLARLAAGIDEAAEALTELAVAFPVYRSYLPEGLDHLQEAVAVDRRGATGTGGGDRRAGRRGCPIRPTSCAPASSR